MDIRAYLKRATALFEAAQIDDPSFDAKQLILHGLNAKRSLFISEPERLLTPKEIETLDALIERRASREPVGTIVGYRGFWDLDLKVTKDVLEPRPDSETLVELCLDHIPNHQHALQIIDCGTGSGCLLLALLQSLPHAHGTGLDISAQALTIALENARSNDLIQRSNFIRSDWLDHYSGPKADIILSNPPYIPTEDLESLSPEVKQFDPSIALDGGPDGLTPYRVLARDAQIYLKPKGLLAVEFGIHQKNALHDLFEKQGWAILETRKDLGGIDRAMIMSMKNT